MWEFCANDSFRPISHRTCCVRHGVGLDIVCPSPGIKTHSSHRRFSSSSLPPFPPSLFTFLHRPTRLCLRPRRAPLTPCNPDRTDTTRPAGKMLQRDRLARIHSTPRQHYLFKRLNPCIDSRTMTLVQRRAFQQVAGDLVSRPPWRGWLRCRWRCKLPWSASS